MNVKGATFTSFPLMLLPFEWLLETLHVSREFPIIECMFEVVPYKIFLHKRVFPSAEIHGS